MQIISVDDGIFHGVYTVVFVAENGCWKRLAGPFAEDDDAPRYGVTIRSERDEYHEQD